MNTRDIPVTLFWPIHCCDKRVQQSFLETIAESGADGLNFNPPEMEAMMAHPGEILRWKKMLAGAGTKFLDGHNPFGPLEDLNCPVPELRPHMLAMHRRCLALCAEFGVKSTTIHVGRPTEYCKDADVSHENLLRSLEQLLPAAEEFGVVVCIENIWDPTNTAGRLLDAIERFKSPWLGICWDSGHAQLSRSDSPDTPEQCCRTSWKNNGFPAGPAEWSDTGEYLRRLQPHIVTCHLHTNDRVRDRHWLPTDPRGKTDWAAEMPLLLQAPRLMQLQNEASPNAENPFTPRHSFESVRAIAEIGRAAIAAGAANP
ncbi:MAG: sugar phosphate isomerase/epimerase [Kiritimatiellae bacterium]|nr:sugar phosphate isomerase/epimerase [Kiritimatiellia bacterium]